MVVASILLPRPAATCARCTSPRLAFTPFFSQRGARREPEPTYAPRYAGDFTYRLPEARPETMKSAHEWSRTSPPGEVGWGRPGSASASQPRGPLLSWIAAKAAQFGQWTAQPVSVLLALLAAAAASVGGGLAGAASSVAGWVSVPLVAVSSSGRFRTASSSAPLVAAGAHARRRRAAAAAEPPYLKLEARTALPLLTTRALPSRRQVASRREIINNLVALDSENMIQRFARSLHRVADDPENWMAEQLRNLKIRSPLVQWVMKHNGATRPPHPARERRPRPSPAPLTLACAPLPVQARSSSGRRSSARRRRARRPPRCTAACRPARRSRRRMTSSATCAATCPRRPPSLPPSFARGRPSPRLGAQAIETIAEAYWEIIGETARRRPRHMVRIGKRVATTASLLALWRWNRALPGWRPRRQYGMLNQALRLITVTVAECRALLDEDDCQKGTACRMMLDNFDDGVDAVDEMDDDVSAR